MSAFNKTEQRVFDALVKQANECTGGEFGYLPDTDKCGLTDNQFAGYISALKAKGVFEYIDTDYGNTYGGQYAINENFL